MENNREVKSAAIPITELLTFNAVKQSRKSSNAIQHNVDRETRLPLYLGVLVHNTSRAQWAHQVSAAALFCLQSQAFMAYKHNLETDNITANPFHEWCAGMEGSYPQFFYWGQTLKLELLFLQFMRSQRTCNF